MAAILIRNVPETDLVRLDRIAERLGLSRSSYLRRSLPDNAKCQPAS